MKGNKWFDLDNNATGGSDNSYWGFFPEASEGERKMIAQHEAKQRPSSIMSNRLNQAEAAPELEDAPMTDDEFERIKRDLYESGALGNARSKEEQDLYLRKFYGL